MGERRRKYTKRRLLARLLIFALLAGILPYRGMSVSKVAETSASAKEKSSASRSAHKLNNPSTTSDGVTTWDCVWFGNYWQNDTNGDGTADKNDGKDPIKWRVLSVNDDDAFLLADTNLDVQKYNDTYTSVTWETCTMRMWLNSVFLNNAFNASEQAVIQNTTVVNEDNPSHDTEGGNDTTDKVYLLSISEAMNPSYGFTSTTDSTDTREAVNTAYVAAGGEIKSSRMNSAGGTNMWWLRSPGLDSSLVSYVYDTAHVSEPGGYVSGDNVAVRPALHLDLSATSSWSYAGTVVSDGGEKSLKLSSIKCRRGSKMISGKVSVSKATVKIKIGKKAWKKAKVKGKKFTLKLSLGLKKETKIMIKVTKKGYKSLVKTNKVK